MWHYRATRILVATGLALAGVAATAQAAGASWLDQATPSVPGATAWQFSAVSCTSLSTCMAVGTSDGSSGGLLAESRTGQNWHVLTVPDPGGAQLNSISCTSASACVAVGDYHSGAATLTLAETWDGTGWSAKPTPDPAGATASVLNRVSCASATSCVAVGDSSAGGFPVTLAEAWNGSNWSLQSTADAPGEASNKLNGVSCRSATHCVAVGSSANGPTTVPLAETWDGAAWAIQAAPHPAGSFRPLNAVSCVSPTGCTAVGDGFAESWDGSAWSTQTIAKASADLTGVSCEATTMCTAVGGHYSDGVQFMAAETWDGATWRQDTVPISVSYDSDVLTDVSCQNLTTCTAVGDYHDPVDGNRALVEAMQLRWHPQQAAAPSGAVAASLASLSCTSVKSCVAVGDSEGSGSTFAAFSETWNGSSWTVHPVPSASASSLSGVSCTSPGACTAVGDTSSGGSLVTLAERWDGTTWSVQPTPNPAGAAQSFLTSVSCPSATACTATGFSVDANGDHSTLAESWDGSTWSLQPTPSPAGTTTSQFTSVSCVSATACAAVGYSLSPSTTMLAETWNGSAWTTQSVPAPAGGSDTYLGGVSCSAAASCTAVGDYRNGSVTSALAEHWNGSSWATQAIPNQIGATASDLTSVSCAHNGACTAVGSGTHSGPVKLQTMAEHWSGTTWYLTAAPGIPSGAQGGVLSSVSCVSGNGCLAAGWYDDTSGTELPLAAPYN